MLRLGRTIKHSVASIRFVSVQFNLKSHEQLASAYPSVGLLRSSNNTAASCVLVNKNIALTNAHCVINSKNSDLTAQFSTESIIRVESALIHPSHTTYALKKYDSKDIAVLFLKDTVKTKLANIDYWKYNSVDSFTAVGYPGWFGPATGLSDLKWIHGTKVAICQSCFTTRGWDIDYNYVGTPGYRIESSFKQVKTPNPLFHVSLSKGMSGGGAFKHGRLFALNCSGTIDNENMYLTTNYYVPLSIHSFWLKNIFQRSRIEKGDFTNLNDLEKLLRKKIHPEAILEYCSINKWVKLIFPKSIPHKSLQLLYDEKFSLGEIIQTNDEIRVFALIAKTLYLIREKLEKMQDLDNIHHDHSKDLDEEIMFDLGLRPTL